MSWYTNWQRGSAFLKKDGFINRATATSVTQESISKGVFTRAGNSRTFFWVLTIFAPILKLEDALSWQSRLGLGLVAFLSFLIALPVEIYTMIEAAFVKPPAENETPQKTYAELGEALRTRHKPAETQPLQFKVKFVNEQAETVGEEKENPVETPADAQSTNTEKNATKPASSKSNPVIDAVIKEYQDIKAEWSEHLESIAYFSPPTYKGTLSEKVGSEDKQVPKEDTIKKQAEQMVAYKKEMEEALKIVEEPQKGVVEKQVQRRAALYKKIADFKSEDWGFLEKSNPEFFAIFNDMKKNKKTEKNIRLALEDELLVIKALHREKGALGQAKAFIKEAMDFANKQCAPFIENSKKTSEKGQDYEKGIVKDLQRLYVQWAAWVDIFERIEQQKDKENLKDSDLNILKLDVPQLQKDLEALVIHLDSCVSNLIRQQRFCPYCIELNDLLMEHNKEAIRPFLKFSAMKTPVFTKNADNNTEPSVSAPNENTPQPG